MPSSVIPTVAPSDLPWRTARGFSRCTKRCSLSLAMAPAASRGNGFDLLLDMRPLAEYMARIAPHSVIIAQKGNDYVVHGKHRRASAGRLAQGKTRCAGQSRTRV